MNDFVTYTEIAKAKLHLYQKEITWRLFGLIFAKKKKKKNNYIYLINGLKAQFSLQNDCLY